MHGNWGCYSGTYEIVEFEIGTHIEGVFFRPILLIIAAYLPCLFLRKLFFFSGSLSTSFMFLKLLIDRLLLNMLESVEENF